MKKKMASTLLAAAIGCYLLNPVPSYAQENTAATVSVQEQSVNASVPAEMVKITRQPLVQEKVTADKSTAGIVLADKNATEKTKELMAYLKNIVRQHKVIFGHQNDIINTVRQDLPFGGSDTKDMTGSISGIFGIDTLALAGCELGETNPKTALQKSVDISLDAAKQGALITLSCHMPNFGSERIKKLDDGTYDFTKCDFIDCKDLSGSAADILPGGKNNAAFTAYMDMIADYALALQAKDIPVIFRPFHENNGSWFWWGGDNMKPQDSVKLFRYMADYLKEKGVHNFIYVYSPNGPFSDEATYMSRYPGDDYVDILAIDYYDDYNTVPAKYRDDFFNQLSSSCQLITKIAKEHNKLSTISEAGVRVMKDDMSGNDGILKQHNPILGHEWYKKVGEIAIENDMPYYLVWANFTAYNCYTPYKYNQEYGHELVDEFIDFYNWDKSVFAAEVNFY